MCQGKAGGIVLSVGTSGSMEEASGSVTMDAGSGGAEGGAVSIAAGIGGTVSLSGALASVHADVRVMLRGSNGVDIVTGSGTMTKPAGGILVQVGASDSSSGAGVTVAAGDSNLEKGGLLKFSAGRGLHLGGDVDITSGVSSAGTISSA